MLETDDQVRDRIIELWRKQWHPERVIYESAGHLAAASSDTLDACLSFLCLPPRATVPAECSAVSRTGFRCILGPGHAGPHRDQFGGEFGGEATSITFCKVWGCPLSPGHAGPHWDDQIRTRGGEAAAPAHTRYPEAIEQDRRHVEEEIQKYNPAISVKAEPTATGTRVWARLGDVLVTIDWQAPAFQGGGPQRSDEGTENDTPSLAPAEAGATLGSAEGWTTPDGRSLKTDSIALAGERLCGARVPAVKESTFEQETLPREGLVATSFNRCGETSVGHRADRKTSKAGAQPSWRGDGSPLKREAPAIPARVGGGVVTAEHPDRTGFGLVARGLVQELGQELVRRWRK